VDLELRWCLSARSKDRSEERRRQGRGRREGSPNKLLQIEIDEALLVQDRDETCSVFLSTEIEGMVVILPKGG
jgi:hypothetical protein